MRTNALKRVIIAALALIAAVCMFVGCSGEKITVTLSDSSITIQPGHTYELTATVDGSEEAVVWATSDGAVATVDQNGKVTAVAEGSATITATVKEESATCAVTVAKELVTKNVGEKVLSDSDNKIVLTYAELGYTDSYTGGDTVTAKIGDDAVTATVGDDSISIDGDEYNRIYGEKSITLELKDKIITVSAFLVTDVIETKEEMTAFVNSSERLVDGTYYGYYKLGANINMEGAQIKNDCQVGAYNDDNITSIGFAGVFDGQGYSISNFKIHQYGVFGRVSKDGVIKNVGFLNAGMTCGTSAGGGIIAHIFCGKLKDVRISAIALDGTSIGYGVVAWLTKANAETHLENVVIDIENRNARAGGNADTYNNYGGAIAGWNEGNTDKFTNVYVIRDFSSQDDFSKFSSVTAYYGTQTDEMTFTGLSEDVWDTTSKVPTMKHALSYTIEHYLGNSTTNNYTLYERYYPSDIAGSTVTTTAKNYGDHVSVVSDKNVLSGTLSKESETKLVAYYGLYTNASKTTATEYMAVRGDKGQVTPITFKTINGGTTLTTVTKDEKTAYKIDNVKAGWTDLIRMTTLMAGSRNLNTNSLINSAGGILEYNGYTTLTFDFYAETALKGMYFGGATESGYDSIVLESTDLSVDKKGNSQDWITFADEDGTVTELESGKWYTVTIDLTEFYNTNGGTMYLDTAAGAVYYFANPRITTATNQNSAD